MSLLGPRNSQARVRQFRDSGRRTEVGGWCTKGVRDGVTGVWFEAGAAARREHN